jgi:hypothetical protein
MNNIDDIGKIAFVEASQSISTSSNRVLSNAPVDVPAGKITRLPAGGLKT